MGTDQFKDVLAIVAAVLGIFVAIKGLAEFRNSIAERQRELRWRKAATAKQLIDEIRAHALAAAALKMLDWEGNKFRRPDGKTSAQMTHAERRRHLRTDDLEFTTDGVFVRDCFDRLMEDISLVENYIRIGLIDFADVEPFFRYYVDCAVASEEAKWLEPFARAYGYQAFLDFCGRFGAGAVMR